MQFGIRIKFIFILIIAAILPLCLGLVIVGLLGYRHYERQRGELFKTDAMYLANGLSNITREQIHNLHEWILLTGVAGTLTSTEKDYPPVPVPTNPDEIDQIEENWPLLTESDPFLKWLLNNKLSNHIRKFQDICSLYVEVLITDRHGRLLAASNKTTDYWQADEEWWQKAVSIGHHQMWVEGINFDESAGVFSLDVSQAVRSPINPHQILGVVKGVVNVSTLLRSIHTGQSDPHIQQHVIMGDGRILICLSGESPVTLQEKFSSTAIRRLIAHDTGWLTDAPESGSAEMIGYARLAMNGNDFTDIDVKGVPPMYVVVHDQKDRVMRPVYDMLFLLGSLGFILVLAFGLIGLYIANQKIVAPLRVLKTAARSIADTARLSGMNTSGTIFHPGHVSVESMIERVDRISTGDEIESLAGNFSLMARRVMNYHVQMEEELAHKTEAIQQDLVLAREFQESLLPSEYPKVPDWQSSCDLSLEFFHVYKPTLSVGGDFFHIEKLTEHRAAIFIADVTGHGARAALVTAILRTLVRELTNRADDPAHFLTLMNDQFYSIMPRHLDCIFATAFYLVLDIEKRMALFASAGHPSALLIDRTNCCVSPVIATGSGGPALGLLEKAQYQTFSHPLADRDAFLLFTDGIIEAPNAQGEELGWERLIACASDHYQEPISKLIMSLLEEANQFMGTEMAPDDLCLVAVEVHKVKT